MFSKSFFLGLIKSWLCGKELMHYLRTKIFSILQQNSTCRNQSVENAGVAFVKGAYERNDNFEKNKQTVILVYDEHVQTNMAKDYQSQEWTDLGMNNVMYHCANRTV